MSWENCGWGTFVEVGIRNLVWGRHWKGLFAKPEEFLVSPGNGSREQNVDKSLLATSLFKAMIMQEI